MNTQEIASLAERLATTRRTQRMAASMPPGMNELDAWEVQAQAILAFSAECVGYCVVGWTADARRQLGLRTPIYAPIASSHFGPDISLRLPEGAIGVQCELALWLGAPVSCCQDGVVDPAQVANAITAVHPAFGLLGRRTLVTGDSHCAAIADFGLHVATWLGAASVAMVCHLRQPHSPEGAGEPQFVRRRLLMAA